VVAAWSNLSDAELCRKGTVGVWSFKDINGHLAAWDLWLVETLPLRLAGTPLSTDQQRALDDRDGWNAEQVARRDGLTRQEQLEESSRARGTLVDLVTALGDGTLAQPVHWPEWQGTLAGYLQATVIAHDTHHREALWAARDALAEWEWCEILAVPGPTTRRWWAAPGVFTAIGVDAAGLYVAGESQEALTFDVWPDDTRQLLEDKHSFRALRQLVDELEEQGWQADGKGREWYSQRFRRRTGP
jgi:hypothetical protein